MSREGDRVIFRPTCVIRHSPQRAPEATLPISLPVILKPTVLKLSKFWRQFIVSLQLQTDAAALFERETSENRGRFPQALPIFVDKRLAFEFGHLAG